MAERPDHLPPELRCAPDCTGADCRCVSCGQHGVPLDERDHCRSCVETGRLVPAHVIESMRAERMRLRAQASHHHRAGADPRRSDIERRQFHEQARDIENQGQGFAEALRLLGAPLCGACNDTGIIARDGGELRCLEQDCPAGEN